MMSMLGVDLPQKMALAVSGGGDSMALLYLAADWARLWQVELSVVTIDHQLRRESGAEAALVKDLGNTYERQVPELLRLNLPDQPSARLINTLNQCILHAPSFTLRGGTREILRGVIARGLGLR